MSKFVKATIGLMMTTVFAKILGFIREVVLASSYGTSAYSDAYLAATNIPIVIFAAIGTAIATTFIPMYFDIKNNKGDLDALRFTNNIFNIVIIICIMLSILGYIFADKLVKVFAVGFEDETFRIAIEFTKILIPGILFTGLSHLMIAYMQINDKFTVSGLVSVPRNIIIIISIILSIKYGYYVMVWGTLLGLSSDFIFLLPFAKKEGYKYKFYIDLKDDYLKKLVYLLAPVFAGVAVNQINSIMDKTLASILEEGSISALNYANRLNGFVTTIFIATVASVIYPTLSKLSSKDNKKEFASYILKTVNSTILLVIPISIGAAVLSTPIVEILFKRGQFDDRAVYMTVSALIMYSIGMIAIGLRDILNKVFYSLQDTKTPMINGTIAVTMNIIFNFMFIKYLKHAGLALATSLSSIICIILLFKSLKKKIGYYGQKEILKVLFKSVISAIIMGIVTGSAYKLLYTALGNTLIEKILSLSISVFIGMVVYLIGIIMLKVNEVNDFIGIFKDKLKKVA